MNIFGIRSFGLAFGKIFSNCIIKFLFLSCKFVRYSLSKASLVEWIAIPVTHIFFKSTDKKLIDPIVTHFFHSFGGKFGCGEDILVKQLH